nr:hypothetical protein [Mycobacterium sp. SM1]
MVKQDSDHLLRDVTVDQSAGEGMPPLMRCEAYRSTVFVADVAGVEPALQLRAVRFRAAWALTVGVGGCAWEQVRAAVRPAPPDTILLGADLAFEVLVDGDRGLAVHLVVAVAQIWGTAPVVDQAVERQRAGVCDAEPAADHDDRYEPCLRIVPAVEVGRLLDLVHDVFGDSASLVGRPLRVVVGEKYCGGW